MFSIYPRLKTIQNCYHIIPNKCLNALYRSNLNFNKYIAFSYNYIIYLKIEIIFLNIKMYEVNLESLNDISQYFFTFNNNQ